MLVLTRKPNQSIRIGDSITINVVRVRGNTIQLGIEAPQDVRIMRTELLERNSTQESTDESVSRTSDGVEKEDEIRRQASHLVLV